LNTDASQPWKNHSAQIGYYTNSGPDRPGAFASNDILLNKGRCVSGNWLINFENTRGTCASSVNFKDIIIRSNGKKYFDPDSGKIEQGEFAKFYDEKLRGLSRFGSSIQRGDYAWVNAVPPENPTVGYHGLLVVGWGPAKDCEDAFLNPTALASLTVGNPNGSNSVSNFNDIRVPYVVDFTGAKPNGLHSPIPKPFYCTLYQEARSVNSPTQPGRFKRTSFLAGDHSWWFFTLPSNVQIRSDQVYVNPAW
jgi:hypothetical protein